MAAPVVKRMQSFCSVVSAIGQYSRTILSFRNICSRHTLQNNAHFSLNTQLYIRKPEASIMTKFIPMKLKRPGNSFSLYMADVRSKLTAEHPEKSFKEISQILSAMWKELPEPEKERYKERSAKIRAEFKQQFDFYKANLTENHIKVLLEMERNKIKRRKLKKGKQELKDLDKPKRFSGPFAFYAKDRLAQLRADGAVIRRAPLSDVSLDWNMMSEEDKLVYKDLARIDMERYQREMEEWEMKMEEQGRHDLLRKHKMTPKEETTKTENNHKTNRYTKWKPDTENDDKDVF